jgi:hypothetical protein
MNIEADSESIGFFMDSDSEGSLVGEALFVCLRAYSSAPFSSAVCQPEILTGYSGARTLLHADAANLLDFLARSDYPQWVLQIPETGKSFKLGWDVCDKLLTLRCPLWDAERFVRIAMTAIDEWRAPLQGAVITNWDSKSSNA